MKANELRIGNIISGANPEFYGFVRSVNEDGLVYYECLDYPSDSGLFNIENHLYPVEITEELLLRFGMKQNLMLSREFTFENKFLLMVNHYEDGWLFKIDYWQVGKMIKYMHQLQNLYFCNIGSEL